jgi:2-C-methyl-D-erythritol 2,4-cyclodiphosphate synthase
MKIGIGYDVHRLSAGRPLILGGVTVPHITGLTGHSDADALTHAVMDALLGAAGLPDIGTLFPDTDAAYKNADSIGLLLKVMKNLKADGYKVRNVSAVIIAQKPKLSEFIPAMRSNLAAALEIPDSLVGISATTTEGLGITGEEKGIAVNASCLLFQANSKPHGF